MIADPVVRNRGTIGGALCQADPSEDLSAVCAAVGARMVIRGLDGERVVEMDEFHRGPYQTCVADDEILIEIRVPAPARTGSAYEKVDRRAGDWAVVAAGASLTLDAAGWSPTPGSGSLPSAPASVAPARRRRCSEATDAPRRSGPLPAIAAEQEAAPVTDQRGSAEYKRHVAGVLVDPCAHAGGGASGRERRLMRVAMTVNDADRAADVEPRTLLVHFLREQLRLTGTHWGCDTSNCGMCVVLMDGEPVKSCTVLAATASGHSDPHGRGPRGRRATRSGAGGVSRDARPPVRVLHPGHDADGAGAARSPCGRNRSGAPDRRRDP